jgi:hypothetical protein
MIKLTLWERIKIFFKWRLHTYVFLDERGNVTHSFTCIIRKNKPKKLGNYNPHKIHSRYGKVKIREDYYGKVEIGSK